MGKLFVEFVHTDYAPKYVCANCGCDVASEKELVWEGFMNISTPAFLFKEAVNVIHISAPRDEELSTGVYTLIDIGCRSCCLLVGWKYLRVEKQEQSYKVGCSLMHQASLIRVNTKSGAASQQQQQQEAPPRLGW